MSALIGLHRRELDLRELGQPVGDLLVAQLVIAVDRDGGLVRQARCGRNVARGRPSAALAEGLQNRHRSCTARSSRAAAPSEARSSSLSLLWPTARPL